MSRPGRELHVIGKARKRKEHARRVGERNPAFAATCTDRRWQRGPSWLGRLRERRLLIRPDLFAEESDSEEVNKNPPARRPCGCLFEAIPSLQKLLGQAPVTRGLRFGGAIGSTARELCGAVAPATITRPAGPRGWSFCSLLPASGLVGSPASAAGWLAWASNASVRIARRADG
jgi:hypothetical protein